MDCPIHLDAIAFDKEEAAALPCGHVFCMPCITQCIDVTSPRPCPCPICKKPTTRKKVIRLFLQARSPGSSPTKSQPAGHLSAADRYRGRALRQTLDDLGREGSSGEVAQACTDMNSFADGLAETTLNIEAKCLGEEIIAAATRFQSIILPELRDLETIRSRTKDLEEETSRLKSTLRQKEKEIDANHRRRAALEMDLANLQMAKRLADDKSSSLRETLNVTQEKLKDAEDTVRVRDETIREQEETLAQYKTWLVDHKSRGEVHKSKIKELERRLNDQQAHFVPPNQQSQEGLHPSDSSLHLVGGILNDDNREPSFEPPLKRRRTEPEEVPGDIEIDRSCFVKKSKASFQIPGVRAPIQRATSSAIPGLSLTNCGQPKKAVVLGSRRRLGKIG